MAAAIAKNNDSLLKPIFAPLVDDLETLRTQVVARKEHLMKKEFEKSLASPEIAQTYASSALKIGKASQYQATKIQVTAVRISRKLEEKGLAKMAKMLVKIATDLFGSIQKELILWGSLNDVIGQMKSKDKKTSESAVTILPALKSKLEQNFDEELTLIDQLSLMTKGGKRIA